MALLAVRAPAHASPKPAVSVKRHARKTHSRRSPIHHRRGKVRKSSWKRHGQQGMHPNRVREIQEALIREKYLTGEPTGEWDARTQDAMTHYQADHGWQSKITPDSRALIKLGLGPDYSKQELLQLGPSLSPATTSFASNGGVTGAGKQ